MIYELKTYIAHPGRYDVMRDRFVTEVIPRLARYQIDVVSVFDVNEADDMMVYMTRSPGEDARKNGWIAFGKDSEWQAIKKASELDGPILLSQSSQLLSPVDITLALG